MQVNSKVFSLGNSNEIRLPKLVMDAIGLETDDSISIEVVGNEELRIRKSAPKGRYSSIEELFSGYAGDYRPTEMFTGIVGEEMI